MNAGSGTVLLAIAVLGLGTYGFRIAGVTMHSRMTVSPRTQRAMTAASVVLLVALAATAALLDGHQWVGWARPAGVAVGAALAWRRVPFVAVVVVAAAVSAGLRLLGVP